MTALPTKKRHSLHDKSLEAKKARILINALVDCAKAGIKSGFPMRQMLWGVSTFLECGWFKKENWRTYHRASDAAKLIRETDDKAWKSKVTLEHARPIIKMYQMLLDERATMTVERAAYIIGEYPAILISMEENLEMAKRGFSVEGTPEQRYAGIKFSGFSLRSEGEMWR